ncbi:DUF5050 domain-containing protein [Anaeromicropila herbilytica]|uniref:Prolow-density lipoprotein receptor-related protein 1-like beta-propeller domain-containing protein n=1 Tax=Anaeromicropila herbilytica TaxID=2785025 RepID=A0A7R7ICU6_9FIRM|nr:DUF5050 domain-containing protein [Anaeromicropila herbilytica]BCN30304.1 hypothetical protein bsdtb5_15990 [Anaeromicropila herbilytica]
MKKLIKFIPFLILPIITMILLAVLYFKTLGNDEEHRVGNQTGNLWNCGLYEEIGDRIYFSNSNDNGALYVMNHKCTHFKKISSDSSAYLNVTNKNIYYSIQDSTIVKSNYESSAINTLSTVGIYRVRLDGTHRSSINDGNCSYLNMNGDSIYYENNSEEEGKQLYSYNLQDKKSTLIADEEIAPVGIYNNRLYYSSEFDGYTLRKINLDNMYSFTLLVGEYHNPIVIGDYIYFISATDNDAIGRCNLDGSNPTILVNESTSAFNLSLSGRYLYYQVNDGANNRLCVMNLSTRKSKDIIRGDFEYLNITSNYLFFRDSKNFTDYVLTVGDNSKLGVFDPPVIK